MTLGPVLVHSADRKHGADLRQLVAGEREAVAGGEGDGRLGPEEGGEGRGGGRMEVPVGPRGMGGERADGDSSWAERLMRQDSCRTDLATLARLATWGMQRAMWVKGAMR
jgi:hypothetical protein